MSPQVAEPSLQRDLGEGTISVSSVEVEVRERVTFTTGSAMMSSFATRALHGVVNIMRGNSDLKLCVEGHCRPDESDSLSSQRANQVLEYLVSQGVPRHRLRAAGFGSAFPTAAGGGGVAGQEARVEFSVIQEITVKGTVQFSPCSTSLTSSSHPLLHRIVALLASRPCLRVRVEGHTDNAPFFGSNLQLAESRAESVIEFLGNEGVDTQRLVPVGFGEKLPRASNSTQSGRSENRRVEFHILQRETVRGFEELMEQSRRRGQIDKSMLRQLERTATGSLIGLAMAIRHAAADLLVRLKCDWPVQRLLHIAVRREDPRRCSLARLPDDCLRRVFRFYFLLGCSSLAAA